MCAVHGVYRPTEMSELMFVLLPTVMSPVGQAVCGQGTIRNILRLPFVPVQVDCWLSWMLPFDTMARSFPTVILALLPELYVQVDRIRTTTPLYGLGTPLPPSNVPEPVPSM